MYTMPGSIHVINVLKILSSRNIKYLSFSLFLSRLVALFFLRRETDGGWWFAPVNCALDVQLARQHRSLPARVLRRAWKTQRKSSLIFQRVNSAFLLRRNQSTCLIVVAVTFSRKFNRLVAYSRWYSRKSYASLFVCCSNRDFANRAILRHLKQSCRDISLYFEDVSSRLFLPKIEVHVELVECRVRLDIGSIYDNLYS